MSNQEPSRTSLRQIEIITLCKVKPRTKNQLAFHFNVNYHTVRKDVDFLHKVGYLKPSAYGSGDTSVLWEASGDFETKGLMFHTTNKSFTIDELIDLFSTVPTNTINEKYVMVAATMCALHEKAKLKVEKNIEAGPSVERLQRILTNSKEAIKQMELLIDQLLTAPIWEVDASTLDLLIGVEKRAGLYKLLNNKHRKLYNDYYNPLFDQEDANSTSTNKKGK